MLSSSTTSSNYGTIAGSDNGTNHKSGKSTLWKSLAIIFVLLVAVSGALYYYGGFNSLVAKNGGSSSSTSVHQNIIDFNSNEEVMAHISEKYYEAMAHMRANDGASSVRGYASCSELQSQLRNESQETTNKFYGYYSSSLNDYLFTVYPDEVPIAGNSYQSHGDAGYLWAGELPGVTQPLYRYLNTDCNGNDHFYSDILANYGASSFQQISGFVMNQECSFNQALYEYYSESTCNHYYTVNQDSVPANGDFVLQTRQGQVAPGIVGYVAKQ